VNLPKTGSILRRLLIIAPLVLVLTLVSLFLPARQVTIKGIGTLSIGQEAAYASPGWLSGWAYRKSHIINSATGAGTNYQVKVKVYYGSGTDSGENVYLGSKCKTDFGDVRFTDDDQTTLLDYWMQEKVDSNYAIFWVEVADDLGTANRTIYIYYGKSDATTTSNGANTFDWFDDFEDGSISGSYTRIGYNGWSEANGILTFTTGGTTFNDPNVLKIDNKTYGWGYEIRGKIRVRQWQDHDYSRTGLGLRTRAGDGYGYKGLFHWVSGTGKTRAVLHDWVAWLSNSGYAWSLNTWYWIGFYARLDGTTRYLYEKDWPVSSGEPDWILTPSSTSTANQDGQPCIAGSSIPDGGFTTQFIGDWDDVFVKKRVYPEPSHGTWGSEERFPLDISNAPLAGKDFGTVSKNSSYWSKGSAPNWTDGLDDGECYFTVTNNSSAPVNISIRATNFSGGVGWIIDSSTGVNHVVLRAGKSGDVNEGAMVILTNGDQLFISGLAESSNKKWELKLETGTFTDAAQKTSTITLTATYP
jgi:hypothetical protein